MKCPGLDARDARDAFAGYKVEIQGRSLGRESGNILKKGAPREFVLGLYVGTTRPPAACYDVGSRFIAYSCFDSGDKVRGL